MSLEPDSLSRLTPSERYIAALMGAGDVRWLADLIERPAWMANAACREHPEVNFFPERGESLAPARAVCSGCLVIAECREYALINAEEHGVWAGTAPKGRAEMRPGYLRTRRATGLRAPA